MPDDLLPAVPGDALKSIVNVKVAVVPRPGQIDQRRTSPEDLRDFFLRLLSRFLCLLALRYIGCHADQSDHFSVPVKRCAPVLLQPQQRTIRAKLAVLGSIYRILWRQRIDDGLQPRSIIRVDETEIVLGNALSGGLAENGYAFRGSPH